MPIYWAFLTYMLLKPGEENHEYWFMFSGLDKLIHFSIFAALGLLFILSFPRFTFFYFFMILLSYGFFTEILQDEMKLGRGMEAMDVVSDAIGITIGYIIYYIMRKQNLIKIP
ncbi:VanZ like family protein [Riemerella columbipharyngis]|uniref:VanZ like family protein n=2 Tax=Riemerella columbipharyngis TaxID=1071918 RepID=A0A1G7EUL1_9FLAO|nr:VanZ like family protein [Riemerella columbipharyngis]